MSDQLRQSIASLQQFAPKLNKVADQASETVKLVEHFLNEQCSLGIVVHLCVESHSEDPDDIAGKYLEYRRVGNKFRIAVVVCNSAGEDLEVKAWADCNRDEKIETYKRLPHLLMRIAEVVQQRITDTVEATKDITDVLNQFIPKK